jgi:pimeloyl-ACP methyl ester carboxylesterase
MPELAQQGYASLAIDLPGHGLNAQFPASYFSRPLNGANFATEVSPLAAVTVEQCADAVVTAIDQLRAGGFEKVVVVAHSAGGVAVTQAVERVPGKVAAVVYLSAFMLADGQTAVSAAGLPESAGAEVFPLLKADPGVVAALRVDFASTDSAYLDQIKSAFYGDLPDSVLPAVRNLLTPDAPIALSVTPTAKTAASWGSVRRHYIKCGQDRAIPPALQQKFIDTADAAYASNKTTVHLMNASHSPFLSAHKDLSAILSSIAGSLG